MALNRHFGLILVALTMTGCAGIEVKRFDGSTKTMEGVPYNLPMTQFNISVTRRITGCGDRIEGTVSAQISSAKVLDPSATFTLHSSGLFSTSDIKSTYGADGVSMGLNTDVADQTGPIVSNVVSSVAAIAPLLAAVRTGPDRRIETCKDEVVTALQSIASLTPQIETKTAALAQMTDRVALLSAQLMAMGTLADERLREAMVEALGDLYVARQNLSDDQKALSAALGITSVRENRVWPLKGDDVVTAKLELLEPEKLFERWTAPNAILKSTDQLLRFDVYLRMTLMEASKPGSHSFPSLADVVSEKEGVPVRFAVPGRLQVCAGSPCGDPGSLVVGALDGPVLQLGRTYVLPVSGGMFQSVTGAVGTDATTGAPNSVQVVQRTAALAAAASTLKEVSTTTLGIPAAVNAAKLARLKAEAEQETAAIALETAKANSATAAVIAPIQAETALAAARLAQINANDALSKAEVMQSTTQR